MTYIFGKLIGIVMLHLFQCTVWACKSHIFPRYSNN